MNAANRSTLQAFVVALATLEPKERRAVQESLQPQLAQSDEALCGHLREFACQHPKLQRPYNDAYQELDRQYQTQVRDKFIFNTNGDGMAKGI